MALSPAQKTLLKLYQLEYRAAAALQASALNATSPENDVAVAAYAAQHALSKYPPASFPQIASYLTSVGLAPPA